MILVKTFLGPSKIHGVGLFAAERIPAGVNVATFDPAWDHSFTEAQLEQMPPLLRDYIREYAYIVSSKPGLYFMSLDNDRFINHSHHPNLVDTGEFCVAAHDIQQDEELTVNYADLEELPREEYTYY
ncbi:MAG TPA: SET domain-containing protein-lysine N-methyltransferase [Verrucomicrobiae bacterium]|jgi:SET domain-containing protein|nr:SET domain-containing protein-lysine N-methyltransferase [Verrucomicrobiae bacterium]